MNMTSLNLTSSILCIKTPNFSLTYYKLNVFINLFKKILTTDSDKFDDNPYGCKFILNETVPLLFFTFFCIIHERLYPCSTDPASQPDAVGPARNLYSESIQGLSE